MMNYYCPKCGGNLYIERELGNEIVVCCINGHRFEDKSDLPFINQHGRSRGSKGYGSQQENRAITQTKGRIFGTVRRSIRTKAKISSPSRGTIMA